jgi:hypothetical protein
MRRWVAKIMGLGSLVKRWVAQIRGMGGQMGGYDYRGWLA